MNIIKNKTPVVVNVTPTTSRVERYAFYTPAFIVEDDVHDRNVEVTTLQELLKLGYDKESSAYIYCALAFSQTERVDSVIIVSKRSTETYLQAFLESAHYRFYFLSLESQDVLDVVSISDYLLANKINKLIFISNYNDISSLVNGRRNVVWLWSTSFWFWDSSTIIAWDSDLDMDLSIKQYPESAWISRCGNLFPSHVQWSCKELVGLTPETPPSPPSDISDYVWEISDEYVIAWDSEATVGVQYPSIYDMSGTAYPPFVASSNYFTEVMDANVTWGDGTTCNREWIDSVVFDDWLQWAIQRNVWKLLKTNLKISSNSAGLEQIKLKIKEVLEFGLEQQGILSYTIKEANYDKLTRTSSFKFNYTRVHAIIGVVSIDGVITS